MADGQENNLSTEEAEDGQAEPSMEEILSSIRRIISEDETPEGVKEATEEATEEEIEENVEENVEENADMPEDLAENAEADGDVLELTRMVSDDGSVTDLAEENEAEMATEADAPETTPEDATGATSSDEDALEMQNFDPVEAAPIEDAAPVMETEKAPEPDNAQGLADSLLADATACAATESFGELARAVVKEEGAGIKLGLDNGKTLEDIVKELLRPMLKEWLDQNLPSITEKLVRKEIERAARRAEEL